MKKNILNNACWSWFLQVFYRPSWRFSKEPLQVLLQKDQGPAWAMDDILCKQFR